MLFLRHFPVAIIMSFKPWRRIRCTDSIALKSSVLTSCSTLISSLGSLRSTSHPVYHLKALLTWQSSRICWSILGTCAASKDLTEGKNHWTNWSSELKTPDLQPQEPPKQKLTRAIMLWLVASLFRRLVQTKFLSRTSTQIRKWSSLSTKW